MDTSFHNVDCGVRTYGVKSRQVSPLFDPSKGVNAFVNPAYSG